MGRRWDAKKLKFKPYQILETSDAMNRATQLQLMLLQNEEWFV
jgi:hypothetical protein